MKLILKKIVFKDFFFCSPEVRVTLIEIQCNHSFQETWSIYDSELPNKRPMFAANY